MDWVGAEVPLPIQFLRKWREVALARMQQREREDRVVLDTSAHLLRSKAHRLLHTWKEFAEEEVSGRVSATKAERHYHQVLRLKMLTAWRARHQTAARKKLLQRQCEMFRDCRLVTGCYATWRRQVTD